MWKGWMVMMMKKTSLHVSRGQFSPLIRSFARSLQTGCAFRILDFGRCSGVRQAAPEAKLVDVEWNS